MMNSDPPARRYADMDTLSRELAAQLAHSLGAAIAARGLASLVVSGGNTPVRLFEILRTQPLDWSRVCIALADERWVDVKDAGSNERLVRDVLMKEKAAAARFLGLKNGAPTPDLGAVSAWETFARVPRPFDAVVLGMGDDGHTASWFPGADNLDEAIDFGARSLVLPMRAPAAPEPRLTLTARVILRARALALHIEGADKLETLARALGPGPIVQMPIRAALRGAPERLTIFAASA
jgi:6-phosphogluconolactonase